MFPLSIFLKFLEDFLHFELNSKQFTQNIIPRPSFISKQWNVAFYRDTNWMQNSLQIRTASFNIHTPVIRMQFRVCLDAVEAVWTGTELAVKVIVGKAADDNTGMNGLK